MPVKVSPDLYICSEGAKCPFSSKELEVVMVHEKLDHILVDILCPLCGVRIDEATLFRKHLCAFHAGIVETSRLFQQKINRSMDGIIAGRKAPGQYTSRKMAVSISQCRICANYLVDEMLVVHMLVLHQSSYPYARAAGDDDGDVGDGGGGMFCGRCGAMFFSKVVLFQHMQYLHGTVESQMFDDILSRLFCSGDLRFDDLGDDNGQGVDDLASTEERWLDSERSYQSPVDADHPYSLPSSPSTATATTPPSSADTAALSPAEDISRCASSVMTVFSRGVDEQLDCKPDIEMLNLDRSTEHNATSSSCATVPDSAPVHSGAFFDTGPGNFPTDYQVCSGLRSEGSYASENLQPGLQIQSVSSSGSVASVSTREYRRDGSSGSVANYVAADLNAGPDYNVSSLSFSVGAAEPISATTFLEQSSDFTSLPSSSGFEPTGLTWADFPPHPGEAFQPALDPTVMHPASAGTDPLAWDSSTGFSVGSDLEPAQDFRSAGFNCAPSSHLGQDEWNRTSLVTPPIQQDGGLCGAPPDVANACISMAGDGSSMQTHTTVAGAIAQDYSQGQLPLPSVPGVPNNNMLTAGPAGQTGSSGPQYFSQQCPLLNSSGESIVDPRNNLLSQGGYARGLTDGPCAITIASVVSGTGAFASSVSQSLPSTANAAGNYTSFVSSFNSLSSQVQPANLSPQVTIGPLMTAGISPIFVNTANSQVAFATNSIWSSPSTIDNQCHSTGKEPSDTLSPSNNVTSFSPPNTATSPSGVKRTVRAQRCRFNRVRWVVPNEKNHARCPTGFGTDNRSRTSSDATEPTPSDLDNALESHLDDVIDSVSRPVGQSGPSNEGSLSAPSPGTIGSSQFRRENDRLKYLLDPASSSSSSSSIIPGQTSLQTGPKPKSKVHVTTMLSASSGMTGGIRYVRIHTSAPNQGNQML